MTRMSLSLLPSLALLLALVTGCASVPLTHYYVLEPQDRPAESFTHRAGLTIGVETFEVDPPYDQDRIVYRVGDNSAEVGFYPYHRWAAPLARMLPRVVASGLKGISGALSVEPAASGRDYEASLRGRLLVFEEIDTKQGQRVRMRVELRLIRDDGTEIWSRLLAREVTVSSDAVAGIVTGLSAALSEAVYESRSDLERALEH